MESGGGSWDPEEEPRGPHPRTQHPQGSGTREGWRLGQGVGLGGQEETSKQRRHSSMFASAFAPSLYTGG